MPGLLCGADTPAPGNRNPLRVSASKLPTKPYLQSQTIDDKGGRDRKCASRLLGRVCDAGSFRNLFPTKIVLFDIVVVKIVSLCHPTLSPGTESFFQACVCTQL